MKYADKKLTLKKSKNNNNNKKHWPHHTIILDNFVGNEKLLMKFISFQSQCFLTLKHFGCQRRPAIVIKSAILWPINNFVAVQCAHCLLIVGLLKLNRHDYGLLKIRLHNTNGNCYDCRKWTLILKHLLDEESCSKSGLLLWIETNKMIKCTQISSYFCDAIC